MSNTRALSLALAWFIMGPGWAARGQTLEPPPPEFDNAWLEENPFQDPLQEHALRLQAKEQQEEFRLRVPIPEAVKPLPKPKEAASAVGVGRVQPLLIPPGSRSQDMLVGALLCLMGLLAVRKLIVMAAEPVHTGLDGWVVWPISKSELAARKLAEERAFAEFLVAFKAGPPLRSRLGTVTGRSKTAQIAKEMDQEKPELELSPLEEFFAQAPDHVLGMRKLLQEIAGGPPQEQRQKLLANLCRQAAGLKTMAGLPELLPVWQVASALEWLLKQLSEQPDKVTPLTLRTVAQGIDLLEDLCQPGLKPELCTTPPMRFLSVDDDAISRHAVSFSLKKAFNQPDVAAHGEAALALVSKIAYDVIFLDVQMPGMNGFELCKKIHETELNRDTPVVFVTCQNDFDARVKSSLSGGTHLLGKPFLTFEITLKALTLGLRARLEARSQPEKDRPAEVNAPEPAKQPEPVKQVESASVSTQ